MNLRLPASRLNGLLFLTAALAFLILALNGAAQTAQELLDKSMDAFLSQKSFSGSVSNRKITLNLVREKGHDFDESRYNITNQYFSHITARTRPPDDWSIKKDTQVISPRALQNSSVTRVVLFKINNTIKHGTFPRLPGNMVFEDTTLSAFNDRLLSFIGGSYQPYNDSNNLVYRYLIPANRGLSNISWGLLNPAIKHIETDADGTKTYCISGKHLSEGNVLIWVNGSNFQITRCVQIQLANIRPESTQTNLENIELTFGEAVYTYDTPHTFTDPEFTEFHDPKIDFAQPANIARFIALPDILKLWADEIKQATNPPKKITDQLAVATAAQSVKQILSTEQMKGIIIVEGDKGRATGFMTKIKNVDFVVTNLHVLGSNKTIALKTMNGETLPFTTIHGAIGRDIALIRIAKTEGSLKLAENVMASAKIGQNVVVAGNKAGGGVATEITGKIKGIGPDRIEIDATFESGNSGSPIISQETGEIIGVATYTQIKPVNFDYWDRSAKPSISHWETRWFGYRLDGPVQWQAISLEKWQIQGKRIDALNTLSNSILLALTGRFPDIADHPRLIALITDFKKRTNVRTSSNAPAYLNELTSFAKKLRSLAEDDMKEIETSDFYDYYQSSLYWEHNIQAQRDYRAAVIRVLKECEDKPELIFTRFRPQ